VIDLSSDTQTRPTPGMREAMARAEVGDEQLREDPSVNALQQLVAELTGKDAALFLPSGTMCNLIAVTAHIKPGDAVILERHCHINISEGGAASRFAGGMIRGIVGDRGVFTAEQVKAELSQEGTHTVGTGLICVENTHNRGGGKVWPIERLAEIKQLADERGIPIHMDGARFMNAVVATGISAQEYSSYADTIWIDLTKGLGAPVGAVLAGPHDFIEQARLLKHRYGGAMRQAGVIAAAGLYAFEHNVERMAEDHANAKLLEAGLSAIPGVTMVAGPVETNMLFFDVSGTGLNAGQVVDGLLERGVRVSSPYRYGSVLRMVTHLDVTRAQCEEAVEALRAVVAAA
jgi:threonine aldolase